MKKFFQSYVSWSLISLLVLVTVVVLGGLFYVNSVQDSLWNQVVNDVRENTEQGAKAFEVFMQKDLEILRGTANYLQDVNSTDIDTIYTCIETFDEQQATYYVINLEDGIRYSNSASLNENMTDEQTANYLALSGDGIFDPYISLNTGQKMYGAYDRFTFADGVEAMISKEQPISMVIEQFSLNFYEGEGFSYVVNSSGDILLRPIHRNASISYMNVFDPVDQDVRNSAALESFKTALSEGKTGVARLITNDSEYVYAYVPLSYGTDWYFISIIPNSVIMSEASSILQNSWIFIFLLISGLSILLIVLLYMRRSRKKIMKKEMEILYREQLFSILANNTSDVFIMLRRDNYRVEYISPNVERILGYTPDEIRSNLSLVFKDKWGKNRKEWRAKLAAIQPGDTLVIEGERHHANTEENRWYLETIYRVNIDDEDKYILTISDRTAERRKNQTLEEALEIAQVANQSKSAFLSNMSHDIRTPMNAIVGMCTLLKKDAEDPVKVKNHSRQIASSSQHLLSLINDILDMSKIESGKTTLNISQIQLSEIVEELNSIIRPQAEAKNQTFTIDVNNVPDELLLGDKLRITQILLNVLSNAIKYTPVGGSITLSISEKEAVVNNFVNIHFTIADTGIGMSEEFQENIFEPFTRERTKMVSGAQGTGLGMAITKNLVDLMGGTIRVSSKLGEGSVFEIDLELRKPDDDAENNFWKEHGIQRILIIDDDDKILQSVSESMLHTGVVTETTDSGKKAVEMLKKEHYDLVLLDWNMPEQNGLETAQIIRNQIDPNIPILFLTAYDWSEIEKEVQKVGVNGFVPKPFFLYNLQRTLQQQEHKTEKPQPPSSVLEGKNILAAEDNAINSEILVELMEMEGAKCHVEENGQKALEAFEASQPGEYDFIFMDLQMPVMNGYDAAKAIRASSHPDAKTIPIVAMTANAFTEDVVHVLEAGMNAHIAKPVDLKKLEEVLAEVLQNGQQSDFRYFE